MEHAAGSKERDFSIVFDCARSSTSYWSRGFIGLGNATQFQSAHRHLHYILAFTHLFARIHPATAHQSHPPGQTTRTKPCFGQFLTQSRRCRQYYAQLAATTVSTAATLQALFGCRQSDPNVMVDRAFLSLDPQVGWINVEKLQRLPRSCFLPCHRNCFTRQPKTAKCLTKILELESLTTSVYSRVAQGFLPPT